MKDGLVNRLLGLAQVYQMRVSIEAKLNNSVKEESA